MKRLLALLLILALPAFTSAAVGYNTANANSASAASILVNLTVGAGTNRVLIVAVALDLSARSVTSITGAGATWASSAFGTFNDATNGSRVELWYGTNPSTGSQNVTVNFNASAAAAVYVQSFNGVDQTTPLAGYAASHSAANPFNQTLSSLSGDAVTASYVSPNEGLGSPAGGCNGANDTSDQAPSSRFSGAGHCLASGSATIGFTNPGTNMGEQVAIVKQVAAAAAATARSSDVSQMTADMVMIGTNLIMP